MKPIIFSLIIGWLGLFMLAGCEKDVNSVMNEEQLEEQSIRNTLTDQTIEESDYLADWGIDDGSENRMYDGFSTFSGTTFFPKFLTPIDNVIRFGRKLNRTIPRTLILRRISPDSIVVNMERIWGGQFVIFERLDQGTTPPDSVAIYRKPLTHAVKRTTLFTKRVEDQDAMQDPRRRWKLSAISLGAGESRPLSTVQIHQVEVETNHGLYLLFTDPLHTLLSIPDDLPTFVSGEKVRVKVLVRNRNPRPVINPNTGATETLLLHFGVNRFHHARRQFEYRGIDPVTGFNLYVGEWTIHEPGGRPFHAIVDVIDSGTIFDDDATAYPYNSVTWSVPYRVAIHN